MNRLPVPDRHQEVREGIALVNATMNRTEHLLESLHSWLALAEVDEVVIVDWSSAAPISEAVATIDDPRVVVVRVEGAERWILSLAYNLGFRFTGYDKILKLDSDIRVEPSFFERHQLRPGTFFCGNWRRARNENENHLNGTVFLRREDFFAVNGYSELIRDYGWDDTDLYDRLQQRGLRRRDVETRCLRHRPHEMRIAQKDSLFGDVALRDEAVSSFHILRNKLQCKEVGRWDTSTPMTAFDHEGRSARLVCCQMDEGSSLPVVPADIRLRATDLALRDLLDQAGLPSEVTEDTSHDELLALFRLTARQRQPSVGPQREGLRLCTSLYDEGEPGRRMEFLECLRRNLLNEAIDEIHVLYDIDVGSSDNVLRAVMTVVPITVVWTCGRPTFLEMVQYANATFPAGTPVLIANGDIAFDASIRPLGRQDMGDSFVALTRWNQTDGGRQELERLPCCSLPNVFSQDAWGFSTPFYAPFPRYLQLGVFQCDSVLSRCASRAGLQVSNPCLDVRALHIHEGPSESRRVEASEGAAGRAWVRHHVLNGFTSPVRGVPWRRFEDLPGFPAEVVAWHRCHVVLEPLGTLEERLDSVACGLAFAALHDASLSVSWQRDGDCAAGVEVLGALGSSLTAIPANGDLDRRPFQCFRLLSGKQELIEDDELEDHVWLTVRGSFSSTRLEEVPPLVRGDGPLAKGGLLRLLTLELGRSADGTAGGGSMGSTIVEALGRMRRQRMELEEEVARLDSDVSRLTFLLQEEYEAADHVDLVPAFWNLLVTGWRRFQVIFGRPRFSAREMTARARSTLCGAEHARQVRCLPRDSRVVLQVRGGLEGRLLCLVSALGLAHLTGRRLYVHWPSEPCCTSTLDELCTVSALHSLSSFPVDGAVWFHERKSGSPLHLDPDEDLLVCASEELEYDGVTDRLLERMSWCLEPSPAVRARMDSLRGRSGTVVRPATPPRDLRERMADMLLARSERSGFLEAARRRKRTSVELPTTWRRLIVPGAAAAAMLLVAVLNGLPLIHADSMRHLTTAFTLRPNSLTTNVLAYLLRPGLLVSPWAWVVVQVAACAYAFGRLSELFPRLPARALLIVSSVFLSGFAFSTGAVLVDAYTVAGLVAMFAVAEGSRDPVILTIVGLSAVAHYGNIVLFLVVGGLHVLVHRGQAWRPLLAAWVLGIFLMGTMSCLVEGSFLPLGRTGGALAALATEGRDVACLAGTDGAVEAVDTYYPHLRPRLERSLQYEGRLGPVCFAGLYRATYRVALIVLLWLVWWGYRHDRWLSVGARFARYCAVALAGHAALMAALPGPSDRWSARVMVLAVLAATLGAAQIIHGRMSAALVSEDDV